MKTWAATLWLKHFKVISQYIIWEKEGSFPPIQNWRRAVFYEGTFLGGHFLVDCIIDFQELSGLSIFENNWSPELCTYFVFSFICKALFKPIVYFHNIEKIIV